MNTFFISQPHAIEMAIEIITLILLWYVARTTNGKISSLTNEFKEDFKLVSKSIDQIYLFNSNKEKKCDHLKVDSLGCDKCITGKNSGSPIEKSFASKKKAEEKRLRAVKKLK